MSISHYFLVCLAKNQNFFKIGKIRNDDEESIFGKKAFKISKVFLTIWEVGKNAGGCQLSLFLLFQCINIEEETR